MNELHTEIKFKDSVVFLYDDTRVVGGYTKLTFKKYGVYSHEYVNELRRTAMRLAQWEYISNMQAKVSKK